jgi:hypothetical protein
MKISWNHKCSKTSLFGVGRSSGERLRSKHEAPVPPKNKNKTKKTVVLNSIPALLPAKEVL